MGTTNSTNQKSTENKGFRIFEPAVNLINSPASKFEISKEDKFGPNADMCERAFNKLCTLWNTNEKSRNFVIHLCVAFTPHNPFNKVGEFECEKALNLEAIEFEKYEYPKNFKPAECALLGIKVIGLLRLAKEITRFSFRKMKIETETMSENLAPGQVQRIKQLYNELPIEVRSKSFAYFSEKSDKYISSAAMTAILRFIPEIILRGCPELRYAINKSRVQKINSEVSTDKQLNSKQINKVAKISTFGMVEHLDSDTLAKLKGLKEYFEKNQNKYY